MKLTVTIFTILFAFFHHVNGKALDEDFGYVDVRPGAHMFWVVYHTELAGDWSNHPLIMWLQGGPGASGTGFGNFKELGPYDMDGNLRDGRWTKKANVMFVDNPVGTGYSYVDDLDLLTTTNAEIAEDLLTLFKSALKQHPDMQKMPFFVYAESYGGKMTADFAIALDKAIKNGEINCNFQGIAMGDSWVSPMDSVNTWGTFLYEMGFVNEDGQSAIDQSAAKTQAAVDAGHWTMATNLWSSTEMVIMRETDGVDFYNVLVPNSDVYDNTVAMRASSKKYSFMRPEIRELYFRHVMPLPREARKSLYSFMNGPQAQHWNIPSGVTWDSQGGYVFSYLSEDFMKPVISSVSELLKNADIHVSVYTGDLDLICDTPGTYRWIDKMEYPQKIGFEATSRKSLHVPNYPNNAGYAQRYQRFSVFTLLRSGHMAPIDVPNLTLEMIDMITQYGAEAAKSKKVDAEVAAVKKANDVHPKPLNKASAVHATLKAKLTKTEEVKPTVVEQHEESPKNVKQVVVEHHQESQKKEVKVVEHHQELTKKVKQAVVEHHQESAKEVKQAVVEHHQESPKKEVKVVEHHQELPKKVKQAVVEHHQESAKEVKQAVVEHHQEPKDNINEANEIVELIKKKLTKVKNNKLIQAKRQSKTEKAKKIVKETKPAPVILK